MIEVETTMRIHHTEMTQECIKKYINDIHKRMPFKSGGFTFDHIRSVLYLPDYTAITICGVAPDSLIYENKGE